MFFNTLDYKNGWLVEEQEESSDDTPANAVSDKALEAMVAGSKKWTTEQLKRYVNDLTSEFAVSRFKELLIKFDAPSSLSALCDYKLQELEELYLKANEAPLDSHGKTKLVT